MSNKYSDNELVGGIINRNDTIIRYFFFEKCTPMFHGINHKVYNRQVEINELVNELYLYLQEDDWRKLRQFDYRVQLMTWVSRISFRFFQKKQTSIIEHDSIDGFPHEIRTKDTEEGIHHNIEIENLLHKLPNPKYRLILRKWYLEDVEPKKLADRMKTTVKNLYNLRRRAIQKLSRMIGKEKNN